MYAVLVSACSVLPDFYDFPFYRNLALAVYFTSRSVNVYIVNSIGASVFYLWNLSNLERFQ